jgi:hypothetical protein
MTAARSKTTLRRAEAGGSPEVTAAAALDDAAWFDRQGRRFRARADGGGAWLVPRSGGAFLRVFAQVSVPADTDIACAFVWYAAAYPQWPIERVQRRTRKAVRKVRR